MESGVTRGKAAFQSGVPGSRGQVSRPPALGSVARNTISSTLYQLGAGGCAVGTGAAARAGDVVRPKVRRLKIARKIFTPLLRLVCITLCRSRLTEAREQGLHRIDAPFPVLQFHAEAQTVLSVQFIGFGLLLDEADDREWFHRCVGSELDAPALWTGLDLAYP